VTDAAGLSRSLFGLGAIIGITGAALLYDGAHHPDSKNERNAGWVALQTGIAAGADWILIPEVPVDLDEMCDHLSAICERGKRYERFRESSSTIVMTTPSGPPFTRR